jgi:hypothetical protein
MPEESSSRAGKTVGRGAKSPRAPDESDEPPNVFDERLTDLDERPDEAVEKLDDLDERPDELDERLDDLMRGSMSPTRGSTTSMRGPSSR